MLRERKNPFDVLKKQGIDGKRIPFMPVSQTPWYSFNRTRNLFIVAGCIVIFMFSNPLGIFYRNIKYNIKLMNERRKFIKELDEEDRRLELTEKIKANSNSKV